ncbi:MAG: LuxR C-terminal-related transcriptional regulator [Gammaproteobacteria bacterium]|nr:LuxR C-terminal-related transcriptional regulator [Gammaproteobacteria bacterium]MDE0508343.1 LuxR C-terminal-related transcriptional regulator [Gammaproteobacteria bacterium]
MHLDAQGRIVEANGAAERIFENGAISSGMGGRLFARSRQNNLAVQQTINLALPPLGTRAVAGRVIVNRPDGPVPLVLRVFPVIGGEKDAQSQPVAAVVVITDPLTSAEIDPTLIQQTLGLTPKEANVAVLLTQGKNVREIATSTYHSEETIRTQIKSARGKLGLKRQLELVLLVRSLGVFP